MSARFGGFRMFALGPLELGLGLALLAALEVALFWAAASLADTPPLGWAKTGAVALGVAAVWAGLNAGVGWTSGITREPLTPETRPLALALAALALAITWAVSAVLYTPLLAVSFSRGMRIAAFQVLLRAFAYVLLAAAIMVVLAAAQIVAAP